MVAAGLLAELLLPKYSTPGCRLSRSATLRESIGIVSIWALLIALPIDASVKLSVEVVLTSTVSAVEPTVSLKSIVAGWLTSNSVCFTSVPKPGAVAVMA